MKKTLLLIVLATVVLAAFLVAQKSDLPIAKRWEKVNELAEKQLPESALKEVEIILQQAQEEKNSEGIIKALIYKMRFTLEKNPDEAPRLILDFETFTKKSNDASERALLHSITADLYAQYYQKNQWTINQRTEVKGVVSQDIKEWTKNIFFDKISSHLTSSLENAAVLQNTDATKYASLLEKGEDSRTLQPTLFDFLANRRITVLQQISQATNIKNPLKDLFLYSDIEAFSKAKLDTLFAHSVENQIIATYQQLLDFRLSSNNVPALLYTDLQRLNYVKEHSEISNSDSLFLSALSRLENQLKDNEAVVEVLSEKANYYLNHSEIEHNKRLAFDICVDGINRFSKYKRIELLKNTKRTISQRNISINYSQVAKPGSNFKIKVNSSNTSNLELTVYLINATAIEYANFKRNQRNSKNLFSNKKLVETRQIEIKSEADFGNIETEITLKTGDYGIYEIGRAHV